MKHLTPDQQARVNKVLAEQRNAEDELAAARQRAAAAREAVFTTIDVIAGERWDAGRQEAERKQLMGALR